MIRTSSMVVAIVSTGISLPINFLMVRWVLRKLGKPQDERRRTKLAVALAILLSLQQLAARQQAQMMSETKGR